MSVNHEEACLPVVKPWLVILFAISTNDASVNDVDLKKPIDAVTPDMGDGCVPPLTGWAIT